MITRTLMGSAVLHTILVLCSPDAREGGQPGKSGVTLSASVVKVSTFDGRDPGRVAPEMLLHAPVETGRGRGSARSSPKNSATATHQDSGRGNDAAAGFVVSAPYLLRQTVSSPRFTDDALAARFSGLLVLELALDEEGRVVKTLLLNPSGFGIDAEALKSAGAVRYTPARDSLGRAVDSTAELRFRFLAH